jgi:dipeptidyl aminopeptidase/acylaminoacyl peptidase
MRTENQKMKEYLAKNGIDCIPKYLFDGSMKKTWRLYHRTTKWWDNTDLQNKFKELGFKDYNGQDITNYSGNGGAFSVFLRAPLELTQYIFNTDSNIIPANKATADATKVENVQSDTNTPQQLTTRSQRRQIRLDKVCRIYGKKIRAGANIPRYL